ncbi:thioredoxin family protein [Cellulomonas sp. Marseille-Q8402]
MELRLLLVGAVLALAAVVGVVWRARNGRWAPVAATERLGPGELGAELGAAATFVQLSAEVCAPCRATAGVLGTLAAEHPGVAHVELDAADRMDLVRRFDVLRTPTVLVLDAAGAVRGRMSGATTRSQALDALDRLRR